MPGRCWRVHNVVSDSQGAYPPGEEPRPHKPRKVGAADYQAIGISAPTALDRLLFAPQLVTPIDVPKLGATT